MARQSDKILVASHDPQLADVRKHVLEQAGYQTISARDIVAVERACREEGVALVMIGYSVPPAEKRRIWATVREVCKRPTPILELSNGAPAVLTDVHGHHSLTPEDFITTIDKLLK